MKTAPLHRPMSEINVTPLVDVVLVLLIIFMVTAPFLQGGLEIDLPRVATRGLDVHEGLIISIRGDRTIAVGESIVAVASFEAALVRAGASRRPVFLKADRGVRAMQRILELPRGDDALAHGDLAATAHAHDEPLVHIEPVRGDLGQIDLEPAL